MSTFQKLALGLLMSLGSYPLVAEQPPARDKQSENSGDQGLKGKSYRLSQSEFDSLPIIHQFRDQPSNQFLIDWKHLRTGHPYLGTDAAKPHTGAHLYFQRQEVALEPSRPEMYPPIYAVADGIVTRIDEAFRLRPVYFPSLGVTRANLRYGVDITFAKSGDQPVSFHYSIEPMVDPGSLEFYKPFLKVALGQRVRKGEIIATMYLPPDFRDAENSHIHFNLIRGREFQSPSIFDAAIDKQFSIVWGPERLREDWPIPPCMGWRLGKGEDPYQ